MKLDKEEAVQIAVINLCSQLNMLDMLESEDCLEVCELVFGNRRSVCLAAGEPPIQHTAVMFSYYCICFRLLC